MLNLSICPNLLLKIVEKMASRRKPLTVLQINSFIRDLDLEPSDDDFDDGMLI